MDNSESSCGRLKVVVTTTTTRSVDNSELSGGQFRVVLWTTQSRPVENYESSFEQLKVVWWTTESRPVDKAGQQAAILRLCYPLVHGWAAGAYCVLPPRYLVLPPRPPPNECLGGPLRGADTLSDLPPHPSRTVVVSIL